MLKEGSSQSGSSAGHKNIYGSVYFGKIIWKSKENVLNKLNSKNLNTL